MVPAAVAVLRRVRATKKRMPQFLADAPGRCERLRAEIEQATDATVLASLWSQEVRPLLEEASGVLAAAVSAHGTALLSGPRELAKLVGEADSALLLSGQQAGDISLASLGPVTGLTRLARGEIDRDTFTRQYGHRGPHEVELSIHDLPRIRPGSIARSPPSTTPPAMPTRCSRISKRPVPWPGSGWHARTPGRRPRRARSSRAGSGSPATARRPDPRW